jgi:hypothetical protein
MRRSSTARLSVNPLEGREVPAVVISQPAPDTLVFVGDGASDTIVLRDNGAGGIAGFATGAGAFSFTGIRNIRVATNGGNDSVSYTLANNLLPFQQRNLSVDLGSSPWWFGSDRFTANLYNPATGVGSDLMIGSTLNMNVFGGAGRDSIVVNAYKDTDVAPGAQLNMNLFGGDAADTIQVYWYGENDGAVRLWADGGAGNDLVRGRLQEQFGSTGVLSGVVHGRDGNDNLGLFMFTAKPVALGLLDGGAGIDLGFKTPNVTMVNVP